MKPITVSILLAMFTLSSASNNEIAAQCTSGYPEQSTSQYVLPFAPNSEYVVGQGNCTDGSHEIDTDQAFAYDFDMPMGTNIAASRGGVVKVVVENFLDNNGIPGQENYLVIQHDDGTISAYYHLAKDGVSVNVGDVVSQGDIIGQSGNTGDSSEAHLHFEVALYEDCETLPVNFKNTREHTNGLIEGESYKATAVGLPGDYNGGGKVDAADYSLWLDTLGSTSELAADGDNSGTVDQGDYGVWKSNFGATTLAAGQVSSGIFLASSGTIQELESVEVTGVPEPGGATACPLRGSGDVSTAARENAKCNIVNVKWGNGGDYKPGCNLRAAAADAAHGVPRQALRSGKRCVTREATPPPSPCFALQCGLKPLI